MKYNFKSLGSNIKGLLSDFRKEGLFSLLLVFFTLVLVGGGVVYLLEWLLSTNVFSSIFDGIWWGIVTLTTVGYGDFAPVSIPARILTMVIMLSGVVITSILSGTIASIYVERKIREGKGLQDIALNNHIIICGWNRYGRGLIESLSFQFKSENIKIVVISEMTPEEFDEIRVFFPSIEMRFIRGDIASEVILRRGNPGRAKFCLIIPDESGGKPFLAADDKTILSALAIKSIHSDLHVTAQIIHDQSSTHLERAQVDEIIYGDEIIRHILSNSTTVHGIPNILHEMLDPVSKKKLNIYKIPPAFVGKNFKDFCIHLISNNEGICIGILSYVKTTSLIDILSEETSGIDEFIRRKFSEAEIDLEKEQDTTLEVNLVPDPEYIISENDSAFLIGGRV